MYSMNKNSGALLILQICQFNGELAEIQYHAEYLRYKISNNIFLFL